MDSTPKRWAYLWTGRLMPYTRPDFDGSLLKFRQILKLGALVGWEPVASCPASAFYYIAPFVLSLHILHFITAHFAFISAHQNQLGTAHTTLVSSIRNASCVIAISLALKQNLCTNTSNVYTCSSLKEILLRNWNTGCIMVMKSLVIRVVVVLVERQLLS